jgi:glycosyltransferase involved in cell wall biosynthesis
MISHSVYDFDGRVRRAAESLAERGDVVDVICVRDKYGRRRNSVNGVGVFKIKRRYNIYEGIMKYVFGWFIFFSLYFLWVTKLFFQKKYDLIHVHNLPDFLVFATIIPKLFGSKIVLDIHDIVPEFYAQRFNVSMKHIAVRFLKWVEKISTTYVDHVIIANDIWKDTLIKRGVKENKVTVILNTPTWSFSYPVEKKNNPGQFTLIYPGTLKEHFGVDIAIEAIDILRLSIPTIRLNIIGWGPLRKDLVNLVAERKLDKYVRFKEPVPNDKLAELLSQADIGVVPKKRGIFSDNALSSKLLDFVMVGIPAVVSRTPVEKFYFDENMVMFFEPENPADLARAVMELYTNPQKRGELVRNANRFVEKHNWEYYKKLYLGVIHKLCSRATS